MASTSSALATSTSCLPERRRPVDGPFWVLVRGFLSRVGADMTAPSPLRRCVQRCSPYIAPGGSRTGGLLGTLRSRSCHRSATSTGLRIPCSAERAGGGVDQPLEPQPPVDVQRRGD